MMQTFSLHQLSVIKMRLLGYTPRPGVWPSWITNLLDAFPCFELYPSAKLSHREPVAGAARGVASCMLVSPVLVSASRSAGEREGTGFVLTGSVCPSPWGC